MKALKNCTHKPWSTEFWLLFAVISNANGSIIIFTTFIHTPFSYISSVIYIICYRFYFNIKPDNMPIAIDLCFSLLSQTIVEYKNWEFALSAAFFINIALFDCIYFLTYLFPEYCRLIELSPEKEPTTNDVIRCVSIEVWARAVVVMHIFQVLMWCFPFGKRFYGFYQIFVGYFLVHESVMFLKCYWEMGSAKVKKSRKKLTE